MSLQTAHPEVESSGTSRTIGVMVVDDSAVVRGLVSRWVGEDPALAMVGKFSNGKLAVDNIAACDPDIVILDIEMPVMDGMSALPLLLERKPGVKIIMASTLTRRNAEISIKALSLGAVDYIPKPEGNAGVTTSSTFRTDLIEKIKAVGGAGRRRRVTRPESPPPAAVAARSDVPKVSPITLRDFSTVKPRILAIGSSTGGPKALAQLLPRIAPHARSIPVVITQHMPATFTTILAEHLAKDAGCRGKEAEDGETLLTGTIYVAPGGRHMALDSRDGKVVFRVFDGPPINFCKPAVDPLFESVANVFGPAALALVLTGMGHDGTGGALRIAEAGGSVIAQDEATSVVWGMPGAAVAAGACAAVLPLDEMGRKVSQLIGGGTQ